MIQEYEKELNATINRVKTKLDGLQSMMINEAYFSEAYGNPTTGGLSSLLGKMKISSDILPKAYLMSRR